MSDTPADNGVSRRKFVTTAAGAAAGFMIVPRHVLGRGMQAPSDLLNIAVVGINGMGGNNAQQVMSQNIVAICDVDTLLLDRKLKSWQDRIYPPAAAAGAAGAGGGRQGGAGAGGGRAGGPPQPTYKNFGKSKAQEQADAKWTRDQGDATLKRFVDEQMPRLQKHRDYREMLEKQKDIDAITACM